MSQMVGVTSAGKVPHTTTNISRKRYWRIGVKLAFLIQKNVNYVKGDNSQLP